MLPHVESGLITLIGATTENPSFEVIVAAALARARAGAHTLTDENVATLVERALADPRARPGQLELILEDEAMTD